MLTRILKMAGLGLALLLAVALSFSTPGPANAQGGSVTFNLCASEGTLTMPDSTVIPIWGYSLVGTSGSNPGGCGPAQLPGPVLRVTEGDTVTINLTNNLTSQNTSIVFPGQFGVDATGAAGDFTAEATAGGSSASYTFTAGAAGTYLYESGTDIRRQVAMGLFGALIVDPATPGQAYNTPATAYDEEAILVLSEIDQNLNNDPLNFQLQDYHPTYWLINGKAYPQTDLISVGAGQRLLVRYLNAGTIHHTMGLLGQHQQLVAKDADPLSYPVDLTSEIIAAGQTADMIITANVPAGARIPLYNRQLHLTTGALGATETVHPAGGMMTFVEVSGLNFNDVAIQSYGGGQDATCSGPVEVLDGGATLSITGNCWKQVNFPYLVTANTMLEFDFSSSTPGEIHGIGFDVDNGISANRTFQVYGSQTWGIQAFHNYTPGNIQHYVIPVGQFFIGQMNSLVFANDHDAPPQNAQSMYTNIRVYEAPPLTVNVNGTGFPIESYGGNQDLAASVTVQNGGDTLHIVGNGWKRVNIGGYAVGPTTVIEFDYQSNAQGEIHGIGLDDNNIINDPIRTFRLHGSQTTWGIPAVPQYVVGSGVVHYTIPVGTFGQFNGQTLTYLTFTNDHDVANPTAESIFSNITIHD